MTNRQFITASGSGPADKKLDEFLEGLGSLVANAVADGIKAGLRAQGVQVQGEPPAQVQNLGRPAINAPAPDGSGGARSFLVPRAGK